MSDSPPIPGERALLATIHRFNEVSIAVAASEGQGRAARQFELHDISYADSSILGIGQLESGRRGELAIPLVLAWTIGADGELGALSSFASKPDALDALN